MSTVDIDVGWWLAHEAPLPDDPRAIVQQAYAKGAIDMLAKINADRTTLKAELLAKMPNLKYKTVIRNDTPLLVPESKGYWHGYNRGVTEITKIVEEL